MKFIIFVCLVVLASNAYAGPKQLDLIGLVPGMSTQDEVEKAKGEFRFVIGGYELGCYHEYIDEVLSKFYCFTGKDVGSRDVTDKSISFAESLRYGPSNITIHAALLKGFTKKFGKPSKIKNTTETNGVGTKFTVNTATWIDKSGNRLTLMSMLNDINTGFVSLESNQNIKKEIAEERAADQKRKF